ncbi:hypothetical protein FACS1894137_15210 [Spirochaetia bacterium]|nr:hypothetical protein FACS1894137_15210 [Spirochaetia bacterium]
MKNRANPYRHIFVCAALALVFCGGRSLHAQEASDIDVILESRELGYSQAAGFVLSAAAEMNTGGVPESTREAADSVAAAKVAAPDTPIRLGELCYFIMETFHIKGSFLYALFPGPRYAYREMRYLRLIPEPNDPAMRVSGLQLMQIMERVLRYSADSAED